MFKKLGSLVCVVSLLVMLPVNVRADEVSDLKAQVEKMQMEMQMLMNRIGQLEGQRAQTLDAPQGIDERVGALENKMNKSLLKKASDINLNVGGFAQAYYKWAENNSSNDTFEIRRTFLTFAADFPNDLSALVSVDAAVATDILRDAWVKYKGLSYANLTVGQFPTPFSYEWNISSAKLDSIERAEVTTALSYKRGLGAMVDGKVLDEKVYYAIGAFNGTARNVTDTNNDKDVIGRVIISPFKGGDNELLDGFSIGGALQVGEQAASGTDRGKRERYAGLLMYKYQKLNLYGEYIRQGMEQSNDTTKHADGWYLLTTYKLTDKLQALAKYEQYDPNKNVSEDQRDIVTLGGTYFVNKNLKIEANYRQKTEEDASVDTNNEFILQTQLSF